MFIILVKINQTNLKALDTHKIILARKNGNHIILSQISI